MIVNCGAVAVPDPLKETVIGELGPLFTIDTLPLTLPAVVGANFAVNDVLCPAPSVNGVVIPLTLKPVPDAVACEMVRLAVPEFFNVIVCEPLLPTLTDPKFTLAGVAPSWPCIPVPDKATDAGDPGALLTIETLPDAAPADVGAKVAVNDALLLALMFSGNRRAADAESGPGSRQLAHGQCGVAGIGKSDRLWRAAAH